MENVHVMMQSNAVENQHYNIMQIYQAFASSDILCELVYNSCALSNFEEGFPALQVQTLVSEINYMRCFDGYHIGFVDHHMDK